MRDTQAQEVYNYMESRGSITSMDAFRDLQITRLSARIKDLRDDEELKAQGIRILMVREPNEERPGSHGRYFIKKEQ